MTTHHPRFRTTPFGRHYARCSCGWTSDAHDAADDATDAFLGHDAHARYEADLQRERAALLDAVTHAAEHAPRRLTAAIAAAHDGGIPIEQIAEAARRTIPRVQGAIARADAAHQRRIALGTGPAEDIRT